MGNDAWPSVDASELADIAAGVLAPRPPQMSLLDFARTLRIPDAIERGQRYDPDEHPAQREVLKAFAAGGYDEYIPLGPAQDGKTWCSQIVTGLYCLAELGQPVVFGMPDMILAGKLWSTKFLPALKLNVPHLIPERGSGSEGGVPDAAVLTNGAALFLVGAGAKNQSGQAGVSARFAFLDEADSIIQDRVQLIYSRTEGYDVAGRRLRTTTVKFNPSPTMQAYERGTAGRLHHPCPHCGAWSPYDWGAVHGEGSTPDAWRSSAHLVCPACQGRITDELRRESLLRAVAVHRGQTVAPDGTVQGPMPPASAWSFRWTVLDSPLKSLGRVYASFRQAQVAAADHGDLSELRKVYHDMLVLPYEEASSDVVALDDRQVMVAAQSSGHRQGQVPAWCDRLIMGVDVQLRRHYHIVIGTDAAGRFAIIDWGLAIVCVEDCRPTPAHRVDTLDRQDALACGHYQAQDGTQRTVSIVACDTGYLPEEVRPWIAEHPRWLAAKGAGSELVSRMVRAPLGEREDYQQGWYDLRIQRDTPDRRQLFVDPDAIIERIGPSWSQGLGVPPIDIDPQLVRHLCGVRPGAKARWESVPGRRHDFLDALIYALAADRFHRANDRPIPSLTGFFAAAQAAAAPRPLPRRW